MRRLSTSLLLAALSAAAVVVATGGPGEAASRNAGTSAALDDMGQDISTATTEVNRFWARHWGDFFDGRYSRPKIVGGYSRSGKLPPYCGNKRVSYNNAFYCPSGDYITWDIDLLKSGYRSGDAWVYLVIAHEWGHAVQARIDPSLRWRGRELQADCLAGAALFGAAEDGALEFEEGDVDELVAAFDRLGDRTPWTKESDHGTPAQRLSAFNRGADGGVDGCLPD
ncbi:neutral zinc metallopeptidase [Nonomuraea sp. NPDC026600]|uniref:neutral zinc metallopeptidase n=1 Tax=Nonomuraea sp. NPDC026600 TaxID=3155363 RepID=UPI0033E4E863